ncbi:MULTISPECIES: hypothetical protein [Lysobacter]|jgi:hypothetical protein|uniref:hypothetical protein n=1 Tax=Lysobacter TaxID=68 RepID=UPI003631B1AF
MNATLAKCMLSAVISLAALPAMAGDPPQCVSKLPKSVQKMVASFNDCARADNPTAACEKVELNARGYDNAQGLLPKLGALGPKYWRAAPRLLGSPQGLVYLVQEGSQGKPITQRYYTADQFASFCRIR